MIEIHEITGKLIIDYRARDWCEMPYPDHPNGCPNYNKNPECPPQAPLIEDWLDIDKPHWFIISEFDLLAHTQRMKEKHPNWSDKQCRCVLYWQNTPRKELREAIREFTKEYPNTISTLIPEAMGVQVLKTAKGIGIPITAKPLATVYKIALVGYSKNRMTNQTKLDVV